MTPLFFSSARLSVSSFLPALLLCCVVTSHPASAQEIIHGSFTWPDRGVRILDDPNQFDSSAMVRALAAHTDGRLYVAGYFNYAGDLWTPGLAAWNGESWSEIGASDVVALVSHASGLYVGGGFGIVGGTAISNIARWDGFAWQPLGAGVNNTVLAIHVQQGPDDAPPIVYVGGGFTQAGGMPASRIARWDGAAWSPLGLGCSGPVRSIVTFDDGSGAGPALYAAGSFQTAGGIVVNKVARWDLQSQTWSPLGQGITGQGSGQFLAVFRDSPDPNAPAALFMAGSFSEVDGKPIRYVARWDGQTWSAVDTGFYQVDDFAGVLGLKVLNDGHGDGLYAPGETGNGGFLQKWDGHSWSRLEPAPGVLYDVVMYNGQLHVGGGLSEFMPKIARFTPDGFGCGDFNGDGVTDQADLGILLASYNCPGPDCTGDADGDGDVDQSDLGILLKHFGQPCS